MSKLKIYTDFEKISQVPHFGYVFPLVEYLFKKNERLEEFYEVVSSPQAADFLALPISVEYLFQIGQKKYYKSYLELAKQNNKKLLVFTSGDFGKTIYDDNVITIRLGGFKSKLAKDTFIMSPFFDDPVIKYNLKLYTLNKTEKPTVGFVGHSSKGFLKWLKEFLIFCKLNFKRLIGNNTTDVQKFYPSSIKRYHFLQKIENLDSIETNFIHRLKYRAGSVSEKDRLKTTLEFFNNIQENVFTFCMRGGGNFSVRFYETLALGRIPVVVDTDLKLPFQNSIDWNKHCVLVKEDFSDFEEQIMSFYNSISQENFIQLQLENRKIWENHFTKEGYFVTLHSHLHKSLY